MAAEHGNAQQAQNDYAAALQRGDSGMNERSGIVS